MAIIPTGAIYKTLNFDGQSSGSYGVYITGDAVFNAPERDVEMVKIPGRNGAFALDNGRFENIEVTYPAGIFAETEADFAAAISDFRNYLCSRKGYCRLTDDYNPDEYRLGIYKSGLEVNPEFLKAGQFNITFECKPQRYLTTGETAVSVTSGDTLTNPTLFETGPLLEFNGYGTVNVNGYEIEIKDELVGTVTLDGGYSFTDKKTIDFSNVNIAPNDPITISNVKFVLSYYRPNTTVSNIVIQSYSGDGTVNNITSGPNRADIQFAFTNPLTFAYRTDSTKQITATVKVTISGQTYTNIFNVYVRYSEKTIEFDLTGNAANFGPLTISKYQNSYNDIVINSTATTFGNPTYIDCDLGEAYADDNGVISSLNSYIALGSDLPKLSPGANTITFDNSIYDFTITPRWWKV